MLFQGNRGGLRDLDKKKRTILKNKLFQKQLIILLQNISLFFN